MLILDDIIYYGRFYSDVPHEYKHIWWLCVYDNTIITTENILDKYSYSDIEEIETSQQFVPLFKTDIQLLEKTFMKKYDEKGIIKLLMKNPHYDYDIAFKKYIEEKKLEHEWFEYERKQLFHDAEVWCKQFGLPYKSMS